MRKYRSQQLVIMLTKEEHARLKQAADKAGTTLSDLCRSKMLKGIPPYEPEIIEPRTEFAEPKPYKDPNR